MITKLSLGQTTVPDRLLLDLVEVGLEHLDHSVQESVRHHHADVFYGCGQKYQVLVSQVQKNYLVLFVVYDWVQRQVVHFEDFLLVQLVRVRWHVCSVGS